jgi:acylphosphatase
LSDRVRKHVIYTGRVQGVGFRATTHSIASDFDVTGFVRNLSDGSVEMVAEGASREVQALLEKIAARMEGYIEESRIADIPREDELQGFRIRY